MKNNGQTEERSRDAGALSNPLSFVRNGYLNWSSASLDTRDNSGVYWSLRSAGTTNSYFLFFGDAYLDTRSNSQHGFGFAVRPSKML